MTTLVKEQSRSDIGNSTANRSSSLFYAVRRGKHGLQSSIFVRWSDCQMFVEGLDESDDDVQPAEYSVFDTIEKALAYIQVVEAKKSADRNNEEQENLVSSKTSGMEETMPTLLPAVAARDNGKEKSNPAEKVPVADASAKALSGAATAAWPPPQQQGYYYHPYPTMMPYCHQPPHPIMSPQSPYPGVVSARPMVPVRTTMDTNLASRKQQKKLGGKQNNQKKNEKDTTKKNKESAEPSPLWMKYFKALQDYKEKHHRFPPTGRELQIKKRRERMNTKADDGSDSDCDNNDGDEDEHGQDDSKQEHSEKRKDIDTAHDDGGYSEDENENEDGENENGDDNGKDDHNNSAPNRKNADEEDGREHDTISTDCNSQPQNVSTFFNKSDHISSKELTDWIVRQRLYYKYWKEGKSNAGTNQRKVKLLKSISFQFHYFTWEQRLEHMQQLKAQYEEQHRGTASARASSSATSTWEEYVCRRLCLLEDINQKIQRQEGEKKKNRADESHQGQPDEDDSSLGSSNSRGVHGIDDDVRLQSERFYRGLGEWFVRQRKQCRLFLQGKSSGITKEQMEHMFSSKILDPAKLTNDRIIEKKVRRQRIDDEWESMFRELVKYKEENGTCHLPRTLNTELSKWVQSQKTLFRTLCKKGSQNSKVLTAARIQRLHDVGFVFRGKAKEKPYLSFEQWIEKLKAYKVKHGHVKVPRDYSLDKSLGNWVSKMRVEYRRYFEMLEMGEAYFDSQGGTRVTEKPQLNAERITVLNELGFVWQAGKRVTPLMKADKKSWDERLHELLEYKEEYGHARVPQSFPKLGEWVKRQRKAYKKFQRGEKTHLTAERVLKLKQAEFMFEDSSSDADSRTNGDADARKARKRPRPTLNAADEQVLGLQGTKRTKQSASRPQLHITEVAGHQQQQVPWDALAQQNAYQQNRL